MTPDCYENLYRAETTPEALEASCGYLTERLRLFLRPQEPVLICFPDNGPESLGSLFGRAVRECGSEPAFWGPDYRWKELLRLTFDRHVHTVIAHPLVVLGLMKIAKKTATPLYIHNVVLGGYPYASWMVEGIKKGLDCKIWGCYAIRSGPVITGFTCEQEAGIHVREDLFEAVTVDELGNPVSAPRRGRLLFSYRKNPTLVYDPQESSILHHQPCSCGCDAPRIVETIYTGRENPSKAVLEERFLAWSSIIDYRARQTPSGIDLEIVVFPGELLPKFPTCARLTVRPWNPDADIPFYITDQFLKNPEYYW